MLAIYTPFALTGALLGMIAFAAGAFGAHALKGKLSLEMLAIFEVGVRYQLIHALLLIILAILAGEHPSQWLKASGYLIAVGTVIFSGSLYILALSAVRIWGAVTPIGGVMMLLGWLALVVSLWPNHLSK